MLEIKTMSTTCIIVLHEIYGVNQYMKDICQSVSEQNFDVVCPNLLPQEKPFDYTREALAYKNFMEHAGFNRSVHKVKELLGDMNDKYSKVFILGFSVGATIAWLCSEEEGVDGVVGYYGSRIRDYVDINPVCPTLLYFPAIEKAFSVKELVSKLKKPNVDVYIHQGQHGFSDPLGSTFNEELAEITFKQTVEFFKEN